MTGTLWQSGGLKYVNRLIGVILVLAFLIAGCGIYTLNPGGKSQLGSIAIAPFENETTQYELSSRLTELIVDAFISDGTIKVLPEDKAEAVLTGMLTRYERIPHVYNESDQVQQYKILMDFQVSLTNPRDNTQLWNETMRQEGIYNADTETEEDGQRRASARLVEAIINKTTKSW